MKGIFTGLSHVFIVLCLITYIDVSADSYVIGVSLPRSGSASFVEHGDKILWAIEQYVEKKNAEGGINGSNIELIISDSANDDKKAIERFNQLVENKKVLAVTGSWDESTALEVARIVKEKHVPLFTPSIDDPAFSNDNQWVFCGNTDNDTFGKNLACYVGGLEQRKNVILIKGVDKRFAEQAESFVQKAEKLGVRVTQLTAKVTEFNVSAEFTQELKQAITQDIDALIVLTYAGGGAEVIKTIRDAGIILPIYGNDKFASDLTKKYKNKEYYSAINSQVAFTYELASLEAEKFAAEYKKKHGMLPNMYAAFAYDGMGLLAQVIQKNGTQREKIREGLEAIDSRAKAYAGICGNLMFAAKPAKNYIVQRDMVVRTILGTSLMPAFRQLKKITEEYVLKNLDGSARPTNLIMIDKEAFYKVMAVYAGIDIYRFNNVDAKASKFDVDFFLWLKWQGDLDPEEFVFANQDGKINKALIASNFDPKKLDQAPTERYAAYKASGKFIYSFDMKMFPFDEQFLPMNFLHQSKNANEIMLVADRNFINKSTIKEIYPQEWQYKNKDDFSGSFTYGTDFGRKENSSASDFTEFSTYKVSINLKRILFFYILTIFFMLFVTMGINFLTFVGPVEDYKDKKNRSLLLFVALVGFHVAMSKSLPQVGYLMRADLFMVVTYAIVCAQIAIAFIVGRYVLAGNKELATHINTWGSCGLIVTSIVAYVTLFVIS
jgi:ABC-type branched-subunit amino acid transport system substrate-binding protein